MIKCSFFPKSKPFCFQGKLCPSQIVGQLAAGLGSSAQVQSFGENGAVTENISSVTFAKTCSCISLSLSHSLFLFTSACYEIKRLAVIPSAVVSGNR